MSESLRNDGRIWLPLEAGDQRSAEDIPEQERDYFLERLYPSYGNMAPRDGLPPGEGAVQCRAGRWPRWPLGVSGSHRCDQDGRPRGHRPLRGNLMTMYERISGDDPYRKPMRIYPAPTTRWAACGWTIS